MPIRVGRLVSIGIAIVIWTGLAQFLNGQGDERPVDSVRDRTESWVAIKCNLAGLSPLEIENQVTIPVESALNGATGLVRLESRSTTGEAEIWAWFEQTKDLDQAAQIVKSRIEPITAKMPRGTEIELARQRSDVTLLIALSANTERDGSISTIEQLAQLRDLAESSLRNQLEVVPGVSQVAVYGGARRQVQLVIDPSKLQAYDVTLDELIGAVASAIQGPQKTDATAGNTSRLRLDDISRILIKPTVGGSISIQDIAVVQVGWNAQQNQQMDSEDTSKSMHGESAILLAIGLEPNANKSVVNSDIDKRILDVSSQLPAWASIGRKIAAKHDHLCGKALEAVQREYPPGTYLARGSSSASGDHFFETVRDGVDVRMVGPDLDVLTAKAEEIRTRMATFAGIAGRRVDPEVDEPTMTWQIDRERASELGVPIERLSDDLRHLAERQAITHVSIDNHSYDLVIMTADTDPEQPELGETPICRNSGHLISIRELASLQRSREPTRIYHRDMKRSVVITANSSGQPTSDIEQHVRDVIAPIVHDLPSGYRVEFRSR